MTEQDQTRLYEDIEELVINEHGNVPSDFLDADELAIIVDKVLEYKTDTLDLVTEFHNTFNVPIAEHTSKFTNDRITLRLNLMFEELLEFAEASGAVGTNHFHDLCVDAINRIRDKYIHTSKYPERNEVEMLDALCDMRVVNDGTILEAGFANVFNQAIKEVHASNMSKTLDCEEDLQATIAKYKADGIDVYGEYKGSLALVKRTTDHKVLKGIHFKAPDLSKFVE